MKVLFLMRDDGFMTEPMNVMELSALAKQDRPNSTTHLTLIERDDVVSVARDLKPDVVAASAITGSHRQYLDALAAIKEAVPDTFTRSTICTIIAVSSVPFTVCFWTVS